MKENVNKHIETLVDKAMKHAALEAPNFDFTAHVMAQVEDIKLSASTTYQPLISKRAWIIVFVSVLLFMSYVFWFSKPETSGWLGTLDFSMYNTDKLTNLMSGIHLSKTANYSILLFAVMLLVQIPILKNYFDKRFEI